MATDPKIGKTISKYKILSRLGEGGMGVVYKAEDTRLKRVVALKFMPLNLVMNEQSKIRFMHEAQAASALDHPRIGTIYEIDETDDGELFIAMAYYEGETLQEKISSGQVTAEDAVNITRQIANGLNEAHNNGIVHRDIKPANIIMTRDGFIKIVDFGLAKLGGATSITQPGTSMGTPGYMSPEQVKGQAVDHRSDIWAVCVIFYEMLTGCLPFKGDDKMSMLYNIVNEPPTPLSEHNLKLPEYFNKILNKAFNKDIDRRYSGIQQLVSDIDNIPLAGTPGQDAIDTMLVPPQPHPSKKPRKLKPKVVRFANAFVVVLLLFILGKTYLGRQPNSELLAGFIKLDSNPGGAEVIVNGDSTGQTTPTLLGPLVFGSYKIALQLSDYNKFEQEANIQNSDTLELSIEMKAVNSASRLADNKNSAQRNGETQYTNSSSQQTQDREKPRVNRQTQFSKLVVTSDPPGASIFLNDSPAHQTTPFRFSDLEPGEYNIHLVLRKYRSKPQKVDLQPGEQKTVGITMLKEPKATLTISAVIQIGRSENIAFAEIFINGEHAGQTPQQVALESGEYKIEAKLFGYLANESSKIVSLKSGKKNNLKFVFRRQL